MDTFMKLPTTTKVVLVGTILFLIVSFFNWQEVDLGVAEAGVTMWHGWGTIAGIVALALLAWEVARLANVNVTLPISDAMLGALVAILLALLTLLKVLIDNEFRTFWAWLGLILAIVVAVAAFLRMQAGGESIADMRSRFGSSGGAAAPTPPASTPPATSTPDAPDTSDDARTT
jgi:uncharacterized membrane protein